MPDTNSHPQRPTMQSKNSSGQSVNLLNNDAHQRSNNLFEQHHSYSQMSDIQFSHGYQSASPLSGGSSPPEMMRDTVDDDQQFLGGPDFPNTPILSDGEYPQFMYTSKGPAQFDYPQRIPSYGGAEYPPVPRERIPSIFPDNYPPVPVSQLNRQSLDIRTSYPESHHYDEGYTSPNASSSERGVKRYPCRYKDTHGCEKTFTTSGHASRHSKIHTAEKGVSCTWKGCLKKFTRADNMKQHLETHTKEKSRTSTNSSSSSSGKASPRLLTQAARIQKPSLGRPIGRPAEVSPHLDPALKAGYATGGGLEALASACASRNA